ncbi:MAG: insulinase family protein [Nitrospirota bacterium]|nr:insulinase family protein [Nitrospirota bacterium]
MNRALLLAATLLLSTACAGSPDPRRMAFEPVEVTTPEVLTTTLDNGIRLYMLPEHSLPLVQVMVFIDSGTLHAPAETAGMEVMLARLLRSGGAGALPPDDLDAQLDDNAIILSAGASVYSYSVFTSTLTRTLTTALERLGDVVMHPRFDSDRLEVARGAMMEGVRRRNDDPRAVMSRQFTRHLYGVDHPRSRLMERETLAAITRDDLFAFYGQHFRPGNAIIGVVGNFKPDEMTARLAEIFGPWQDAPVIRPDIPPLPDTGPRQVLLFEKEPDQAAIRIGQTTLNRLDPDYYHLNLAVTILGGGAFTNRLFKEVRSRRGLAYTVGAGLAADTRNRGTFSMTVYTNPESAGEAVQTMLDEVRRMGDEPMPQAELDDARNRFLNQFVFLSDTASKVLRRRISQDLDGLPQDELERIRQAVIDATPEDIRRVVKKHLDPERMLIVAVGGVEALTEQLAPFGPVTVLPLEDSLPLEDTPPNPASAGN